MTDVYMANILENNKKNRSTEQNSVIFHKILNFLHCENLGGFIRITEKFCDIWEENSRHVLVFRPC